MKPTRAAVPPLGEVLDFLRVIWAFDHALQASSKRLDSTIGVTTAQRMVVRIVGRFPGLSAGQVAAVLHTHPSTVTGLLKRLSKKGLIRPRRHSTDRRRLALGLTAKGHKLDVENKDSLEAAITAAFQELGPAIVRRAREGLTAIAPILASVIATSR